jgi:hypothetical protein
MGFARYARSLVQRFQNRPFAMFGVNSDTSPEVVSEVEQQEGFTWDSVFDGGGTGGPIAIRWGVQVWPTIFVIDHKGTIRWVGNGIPIDFEEMLDKLVAAARRPR